MAGRGAQVQARKAGHRRDEPLVGHVRQRGGGRGHPECTSGRGRDDRRLRRRERAGAALHDGAAHESGGARVGQDSADDRGPGGLAEEGDGARVTAEVRGVGGGPSQRREDVEQATVVGGVRQAQEPGDAEPVVDGDEDDAVAGEGAAVVQGRSGRPADEAAAVDEDHDRRRTVTAGGCPDVDGEVVGAAAPAGPEVRGHVEAAEQVAGQLGRGGTGDGGVADPGPAGVRPGRGEPVPAGGRGGVRHP
ncbi:hypothetical protein GCM10027610_089650 [Dactylosporangium cerinum]